MIRILVADEVKLMRKVIRLYLEQASDMTVVDEAPEWEAALERARSSQPHVLLMNEYLIPMDYAGAAVQLRQQGCAAAILVACTHPQPALIQRAFASGVDGFLGKDDIPAEMVDAVRTVHRRERYLSPQLAVTCNRTIQ